MARINTARIPVDKLEDDCYDWFARHKEKLQAVRAHSYECILIGDSLTHFWEVSYGKENWQTTFADCDVLNLGFGWDRTQNVLWRLAHGEFEHQTPAHVVLNIGGNNFSGTEHATANTPDEIAEANLDICRAIHALTEKTDITVMGTFPRYTPENPDYHHIAQLNEILSKIIPDAGCDYRDIRTRFLNADGTLIPAYFQSDLVHLSNAGYAIWADAISDIITNCKKKKSK